MKSLATSILAFSILATFAAPAAAVNLLADYQGFDFEPGQTYVIVLGRGE